MPLDRAFRHAYKACYFGISKTLADKTQNDAFFSGKMHIASHTADCVFFFIHQTLICARYKYARIRGRHKRDLASGTASAG